MLSKIIKKKYYLLNNDMENEELIISVLEGQDLTQEQIADVVSELEDINNHSEVAKQEKSATSLETELKLKLLDETDWRKKATIAAKIISLNLE